MKVQAPGVAEGRGPAAEHPGRARRGPDADDVGRRRRRCRFGRRGWRKVGGRRRGVRQRSGHRVDGRVGWRRRCQRVDRRRRELAVQADGVDSAVTGLLGVVDHVARGGAGQSGAADRPGATALSREHALSDGDLLFLGGHVRRRGVFAAAVRGPGAGRELQPALISVSGVDGPVAAGLAAGDLVPFAIGGGTGVPGEGEPAAADDRAGEGDFGD